MKKIIFILFFLFWSAPAFSATYYVANNGNDSNNGTSTSTPFRTGPTMDCGSGWNGITVQPGDIIIFKGGDTWGANAVPSTDCIAWAIPFSGTSGHPITLKSDSSWYTGGSFTRPIFDSSYYAPAGIILLNVSYINIDGIEFSHTLNATPGTGYGTALIGIHNSHDLHFTNLYLHGWRLGGSGQRNDGIQGGIIVGNYVDNTNDPPTVTISDSVIENSENTGDFTQNGLAARNVGVMTRVTIHDVASAVLFTIDWNGGTMYNVDYPVGNRTCDQTYTSTHTNGAYVDPDEIGQTTGYIRNSIFHDMSTNMAYPNIRNNHTVYVYNNIFYGFIGDQKAINIEPYHYTLDSNTGGNAFISNNLCYLENQVDHICINQEPRAPYYPNNITITNTHVIGPSGSVLEAGIGMVNGTYSNSTNLIQLTANAVAQGYIQANLWAPQNGNGSTVGAGTNQSAFFTTDINGNTRSGNWNIGPYQYQLSPIIYMSTTGNDSTGDGSFALPYLTFAKAKTVITCGGTIIVRGGTYTASWGISYTDGSPQCSSYTTPVIVTNYQSELVTVRCNGSIGSILNVIGNSGTRTNFYWKFVANHQNDIKWTCTNGIYQANNVIGEQYSNFIWLENIEVTGSWDSGYIGGGYDWTLKNMNFHDLGSNAPFNDGMVVHNPAHDLYHTGKRMLIDGGIYCGGADYNIQIFNVGTEVTDDNVVRNATICNSAPNGGFTDGGIILASGYRNQAYNNVIINNKGRGIIVDYRCHDCAVYDNTVVSNTQGAVAIANNANATTGTLVKGNIVDFPIEDSGTNSIIGTNFNGTPNFTDPSSGDYTLLANSAAIGACANLSSLSITGLNSDKNSIPRPNGNWSCGAYEGAAATRSFTINISSAYKGDSNVAIIMTGTNTNWSNGTSACSFVSNSGITIVSTAVANATMATCTFNIAANATAGTRTMIMTTGGNTETLDNGFNILNIPPSQTTRGSSLGMRLIK